MDSIQINTLTLLAGKWQSEADNEPSPMKKGRRAALRECADALRTLCELRFEDCPHAAPFRYCPECVVNPCPIGLGNHCGLTPELSGGEAVRWNAVLGGNTTKERKIMKNIIRHSDQRDDGSFDEYVVFGDKAPWTAQDADCVKCANANEADKLMSLLSMWKFELNQKVTIMASGEAGEVIARAEYATCERSYLLRYKAGDGRAVEAWWTESAIA